MKLHKKKFCLQYIYEGNRQDTKYASSLGYIIKQAFHRMFQDITVDDLQQ